jgi:F-type H+-transporting ATPase subunit delta
MKVSREIRSTARQIFRACFVQGRMDEKRVRTVVDRIISTQPRHYLGILTAMEKMIRLEINKHALLVESAMPLDDNRLRDIQAKVQSRFPALLAKRHEVRPSLVGGLRIQVGSDVWDGSIAARLEQLKLKN